MKQAVVSLAEGSMSEADFAVFLGSAAEPAQPDPVGGAQPTEVKTGQRRQ